MVALLPIRPARCHGITYRVTGLPGSHELDRMHLTIAPTAVWRGRECRGAVVELRDVFGQRTASAWLPDALPAEVPEGELVRQAMALSALIRRQV